jgi:hypothetical protein
MAVQIADRPTVTEQRARMTRPELPDTHRPSAAVQDKTIRLLLAGWAAHVRGPHTRTDFGVDVEYRILSATEPERWYQVTRSLDRNTLRCSCMGGQKGMHCWHLTMVQLLTGLCGMWEPEQPITPPQGK